MSTGGFYPMNGGDVGPSLERAKRNQRMADQVLEKFDCQLDRQAIKAAENKGGVGYVSGRIDARTTRVDDGQLVLALRGTLHENNVGGYHPGRQSQPLIPALTNIAGIGSRDWTEVDFVNAVVVLGIAATIADQRVGREPSASRPMFTTVVRGFYALTNNSNQSIPPLAEVFWTPSPTDANTNTLAARGHYNNVPYLNVQVYDPMQHDFSRELLRTLRERAQSGSALLENQKFAGPFDESFDQYVEARKVGSLLEAMVLVGSASGNATTVRAAIDWCLDDANAAAAGLRDAAAVIFALEANGRPTSANQRATKVLQDFLAPNPGREDNFAPEVPVPGVQPEEYRTLTNVQNNSEMLAAQAIFRFRDYYSKRILGYYPHGCKPFETSEFVLKRNDML